MKARWKPVSTDDGGAQRRCSREGLESAGVALLVGLGTLASLVVAARRLLISPSVIPPPEITLPERFPQPRTDVVTDAQHRGNPYVAAVLHMNPPPSASPPVQLDGCVPAAAVAITEGAAAIAARWSSLPCPSSTIPTCKMLNRSLYRLGFRSTAVLANASASTHMLAQLAGARIRTSGEDEPDALMKLRIDSDHLLKTTGHVAYAGLIHGAVWYLSGTMPGFLEEWRGDSVCL